MKRIFFSLLLIFLVACSAPVEPITEPDDSFDEGPNGEIESDSVDDSVIGSDEVIEVNENEEKLADLIKPNDKSRVYPTSKKLDEQDVYSFAYGLSNNINQDVDVKYEVEFLEARDTSSNTIFADDEIMMGWLVSKHSDVVTVPKNGNYITSLQFAVGSIIADDVDVKDGTYVFRIYSYTADTMDRDQPEEFGRVDVALRVE